MNEKYTYKTNKNSVKMKIQNIKQTKLVMILQLLQYKQIILILKLKSDRKNIKHWKSYECLYDFTYSVNLTVFFIMFIEIFFPK